MEDDQVAEVSAEIAASPEAVWDALTNPEKIARYMFGTQTQSEWREGSPITWTGEFNGSTYEDKGRIIELSEPERLSYTHFSPLSGAPDEPENYHTVTIDLVSDTELTTVRLTQNHNPNDEARQHSEANWQAMLDGLKEVVEAG